MKSWVLRRICTSSLSRAVRPVPLKVITVSRSAASSKAAQLLAQEWADKTRRYVQLAEIQIKPNPMNTKDPEVAKIQEGERVLKAVGSGERLVVLDERGRAVTSEDVAQLIARGGDEGWPAIVFAIGGPHGHSSEVRARADYVVSLSPLVLNHSVAHIVLLEQLYRAWTILRGEPYHH